MTRGRDHYHLSPTLLRRLTEALGTDAAPRGGKLQLDQIESDIITALRRLPPESRLGLLYFLRSMTPAAAIGSETSSSKMS